MKQIRLTLEPQLLDCWPETDCFNAIMQTQGIIYRAIDNRTTLQFMHHNQGYFIKKHQGIGWAEVIKNLCFGRLPITGAKPEFKALTRLKTLGIAAPTVAGFGEKGSNPANKQSFLITHEVSNIVGLDSLEQAWKAGELSWSVKQALLKKVVYITKQLHEAGINHRDLYACHFMIKQPVNENSIVYLMDLHRAQLRAKIPERWQVKDLASLYYSILDFGLTKQDHLRFLAYYTGQAWPQAVKGRAPLWQKVKQRTRHFVRRHKKFFTDNRSLPK